MQTGIQGPVATRVNWYEKSLDTSKGSNQSAFKYLPQGDDIAGCTIAYGNAPFNQRPGERGFYARHTTWTAIRGTLSPPDALSLS